MHNETFQFIADIVPITHIIIKIIMKILKCTHCHNVLGTELIGTEEAKDHENYVEKVHKNRCPHVAQEVHNLSLDDGELKRGHRCI